MVITTSVLVWNKISFAVIGKTFLLMDATNLQSVVCVWGFCLAALFFILIPPFFGSKLEFSYT